MKTDILIRHLKTRNCKECDVKFLCERAGGECLLPNIAAKAIRDMEETNKMLLKQNEELKRSLTVSESDREYFRSRYAFLREVEGIENRVISVEGYKAFRGTMRISSAFSDFPPYDIRGEWLYKPGTGCWYGCGKSFPESVCKIVDIE